MSNRKEIQDKHESWVVDKFLTYLNRIKKSRYLIYCRPQFPNPPEAILFDKNQGVWGWIEVVDVYRPGKDAQEERSYATPGEESVPHDPKDVVQDPDEKIAEQVFQELINKLNKKSYDRISSKFGKGILIINERVTGLFDDSTLEEIKENVRQKYISKDRANFKEVFLGFRKENMDLSFEKLYQWVESGLVACV